MAEMKECLEAEFDAFIAQGVYKTKIVPAGSAELEVYYDEPEYSPSKRDAYKTLNLPINKYFIKS
jgi:hypothetical protein